MSEATTLVHKLREWAAKTPDAPALYGRGPQGWTPTSWKRYDEIARTVGKALIALGHKPGEAVALIGRNRPEWLFANNGILTAGGVPAPIYTTSTPEQTAYVIRHCKARMVIAENKEQYEKLLSQRKDMPAVEKVVLMDEVEGRDPQWSIPWTYFLGLGEKGDPAALEARVQALRPDGLALLCYTSGTTGQPKGVMLTHEGFLFVADLAKKRYGVGQERILSYLPLCHVAEHMFTNVIQLVVGTEVFMCEDLTKVKDYLPEVRPTLFLAVPRVWEKFEAALRARLAEAKGLKAKLAAWALRTELRCFEREVATGAPVRSLGRKLARKLVISKIHAKLGLDRVKLCFAGAAPLSRKTEEFFASIALPIHNNYGMTETACILTTALPGRSKFGTVGKPLDGIEVKIAADGEIIARGRNMTKGYLDDPAQTAELLEGGWLHTGDVGEFDEEGFLKITDRKKELFKTSGAKYIAPQAIEARLKAIRGISQAVAIGNAQKYVVALVTLDPENAPKVAAELGLAETRELAAIAKDPRFRRYVDERLEADVNAHFARFEQVKKLTILAQDFSVAGGELTPTMKLRRTPISAKYAAEIEALYAEEPATAEAAAR